MPHLRRVGPEFLSEAPQRLRFIRQLSAAPDAVFAELSGDANRWRLWFPGVADGGNPDASPFDVGARRWVRLPVAGRFDETVIVHEAPRRWAFRVDHTSLPIARALVEGWDVRAVTQGTELTWTFAVDPLPAFRVALLGPPVVMGAVFRRAVANLDALLRSS